MGCNVRYVAEQGRPKKLNKKHNTICVGHHYTLTNTDNVNKT